jgi:transcriptional regulator GlxA family with amidase domain
MLIHAVVFDGVDELDLVGPIEVLRNAKYLGVDVTVRVVTQQPQTTVRGAHGLRFSPQEPYTPGADAVLVPGGGWVARAEQGAWGEVRRGNWLPLLRDAAAGGALMLGVCTGTMLLAHAGVVGSRRATTHHAARADLAATGAHVVNDRVVDDGDLITSGGVTNGIDLALWLVERLAGRETADDLAVQMEYSRVRPDNTEGTGT